MFVFSRGCQAIGSNLSLASQIPLMSVSCFIILVRHYTLLLQEQLTYA